MSSRTRKALGIALATGWLLGGWTLDARADPAADSTPLAAHAHARRPLAFEPNLGQTEERVKFLSHGDGYLLFLTPQEATLALQGRDGTGRALRLRWVGASPAPGLSGEAPLRGRSHYMRGKDPARWYRDVPNYGKVRYEEVYPGVDLLFYGREGRLEYDLLLEPGADPGVIRLAVDGADRLAIDPAGDLVATLGGEEVRFLRPVSYQETGGVRREVGSRYRLLAGGEVGFAVDAHDPARPLVIDPVVLYSVSFGGSDVEESVAVGVDADGNTYHAGETTSPELPREYGPPATVSTWPPHPYILDAFVTMLDPAGEVVFSTYIGTQDFDEATDLAVSPLSGVWVSGITSNFDGMGGWVVHLDPFGAPVYWTGSFPTYQSRSRATGVAVDPLGNAYVAGFNFYGAQDAWAVKVNPEGLILYSAYLGGEWGGVEPSGIAADAAGNVWVTGMTWSSDFPLVRPFQSTLKGERDAFLVKLDPSGTVVFSSYLGGSGWEEGRNVAVGPDGSVYVAGYTGSNDFPTRQPLQPARRGAYDVFLSRFSPTAYLMASTYLGSSGGDALDGLAVDRSGIVYLASASGAGDSPLRDPALPDCRGPLLGSLDRSLQAVLQTACLPGKIVHDIAANSPRLLYVTGRESGYTYDVFAAKLVFNRPPQCGGAFASLATLWPPDGKLLPVTVRGVTDPERDPVTITLTSAFQDEFLTSPGTPDASGVGTSTARLRASRILGGDGRVYHLSYTATDTRGGTCSGTVKVCVPIAQGGSCSDGGARIDSTRSY